MKKKTFIISGFFLSFLFYSVLGSIIIVLFQNWLTCQYRCPRNNATTTVVLRYFRRWISY